MKWAAGVLTWNRHERCAATLGALLEGLQGECAVYVLDNGSDEPFSTPLPGVTVWREDENRGAGAGVTALVRRLLDVGATRILFLEDDWTLTRQLSLDGLLPILSRDRVGQVRLAARDRRPSDRYWTYGLEGQDAERARRQGRNHFLAYREGEYQIANMLWSNNPFACKRATAERFLLTGQHELAMARPYYDSGMLTASTTPGYFVHHGSIRDRRGEPGWKR